MFSGISVRIRDEMRTFKLNGKKPERKFQGLKNDFFSTKSFFEIPAHPWVIGEVLHGAKEGSKFF